MINRVEFAARDFLATAEGLFFAVVSNGTENGRVLSFLRYHHDGCQFRKLDSSAAWRLLREQYPGYLYRSTHRDVELHGIPLFRIQQHCLPHLRASQLLQSDTEDPLEQTTVQSLRQLIEQGVAADSLGVTGSLLIGAHGKGSDIDIVIRERKQFRRARDAIRKLVQTRQVEPLSDAMWREAYARRGCNLTFSQYVWHEQRKFNKLCVDGTKIDISLALRDTLLDDCKFYKLNRVEFTALVADDSRAFDYPAVWEVVSDITTRVVSWTPTYTGQAIKGETILVRGWLERSEQGTQQVVVGSSREAPGEVIAVVESCVGF